MMNRLMALVLVAGSLLAAVPARAQQFGSPNSPVPPDHPAYGWARKLSHGVWATEIAEDAFDRTPRTRMEFALATRSMILYRRKYLIAASSQPSAARPGPECVSPRTLQVMVETWELSQLIQEFRPELAGLGVDRSWEELGEPFQSGIRRLHAAWERIPRITGRPVSARRE